MDNEGDDTKGLNKYDDTNVNVKKVFFSQYLTDLVIFITSYFKIKELSVGNHLPQIKMGPQLSMEDFNKTKLKQLKINKCHKILREIFFNIMFIWTLFVICYSNRNQHSYNYKELIKHSFKSYEEVFLKFFSSFLSHHLNLNYL
jgi:hypothetical protein